MSVLPASLTTSLPALGRLWRRAVPALLLACMAMFTAPAAHAATTYVFDDTSATGQTSQSLLSSTHGESFTSTVTGTLSSFQIMLSASNPSDGGTVTISLWTDNGSATAPAPVSQIDTQTINDSTLSTSAKLISITGLTGNALVEGVRYWVILSTSSFGTSAYRSTSLTGTTGAATEWHDTNSGTATINTSGSGAYIAQIGVTPQAVPEPSSFAVMLAGVGGLLIARAASRRAAARRTV